MATATPHELSVDGLSAATVKLGWRTLRHESGGQSFLNLATGEKSVDRPYDRCGTFGCILQDCHSGLHVIDAGERSARNRRRRQPLDLSSELSVLTPVGSRPQSANPLTPAKPASRESLPPMNLAGRKSAAEPSTPCKPSKLSNPSEIDSGAKPSIPCKHSKPSDGEHGPEARTTTPSKAPKPQTPIGLRPAVKPSNPRKAPKTPTPVGSYPSTKASIRNVTTPSSDVSPPQVNELYSLGRRNTPGAGMLNQLHVPIHTESHCPSAPAASARRGMSGPQKLSGCAMPELVELLQGIYVARETVSYLLQSQPKDVALDVLKGSLVKVRNQSSQDEYITGVVTELQLLGLLPQLVLKFCFGLQEYPLHTISNQPLTGLELVTTAENIRNGLLLSDVTRHTVASHSKKLRTFSNVLQQSPLGWSGSQPNNELWSACRGSLDNEGPQATWSCSPSGTENWSVPLSPAPCKEPQLWSGSTLGRDHWSVVQFSSTPCNEPQPAWPGSLAGKESQPAWSGPQLRKESWSAWSGSPPRKEPSISSASPSHKEPPPTWSSQEPRSAWSGSPARTEPRSRRSSSPPRKRPRSTWSDSPSRNAPRSVRSGSQPFKEPRSTWSGSPPRKGSWSAWSGSPPRKGSWSAWSCSPPRDRPRPARAGSPPRNGPRSARSRSPPRNGPRLSRFGSPPHSRPRSAPYSSPPRNGPRSERSSSPSRNGPRLAGSDSPSRTGFAWSSSHPSTEPQSAWARWARHDTTDSSTPPSKEPSSSWASWEIHDK